MSVEKVQPWNWLRNDKLRFIVMLKASIAGFLVAFTVATVQPDAGSNDPYSIDPPFVAVLGGIGGLLGGLILSGWFGRPGAAGWLLALLAALLSPSLAGAISGSLLAPGLGTYFGAQLALLTFSSVQSASVWLACLIIIHLHTRFQRKRMTLGGGKSFSKKVFQKTQERPL